MSGKAISPVVATVLLLVVVVLSFISLSGWLQGYISSLQAGLEAEQSAFNAFTIEKVSTDRIYLRNQGKNRSIKRITVQDQNGNEVCSFTNMPARDELIGYWNFEEYNSTHVFDSSSYDHHGTFIGNVTFGSGVVGKAAQFSGKNSGDAINISRPDIFVPDEFTLSTWVKSETADRYQYIFSNARDCNCTASVNYTGIDIELDLSEGNENTRMRFYNDSITNSMTPNFAESPLSEWHHFVYWFNGSLGKIYLDGDRFASKNFSIGPVSPGVFDTMIGTMGHNAGTYTLNGSLDEMYFYNTSLTEQQVKQLYTFNTLDIQLEEGMNTVPTKGCELLSNKQYEVVMIGKEGEFTQKLTLS